MKKYYVTVNGNRYEVEVEEVKGEFSPSVAAASTVSLERNVEVIPQVSATKQTSVKAVSNQEPKEATKVAPVISVGEKIECPMPGTIIKVNINESTLIKKGQVIFVLEAMKMENEIMAPRDGKVIQVAAVRGAVVNTGDVLAIIE